MKVNLEKLGRLKLHHFMALYHPYRDEDLGSHLLADRGMAKAQQHVDVVRTKAKP